MGKYAFKLLEGKALIRSAGRICEMPDELLKSQPFREFLVRAVENLQWKNSPLLEIFGEREINRESIDLLLKTFQYLVKMEGDLVPNIVEGSDVFFADPERFNDFVEYLYNYWRHFDRFIVVSNPEGQELDHRPYRTFNDTIEQLTHLVRGTYRDIQENITHRHPRIYRQVSAGADVSAIACPTEIPLPDGPYGKLDHIPIIRQVLLYPPLVLEPPMNRRTGQFQQVGENPLSVSEIDPTEWLCYPAKVGELVILVYFQERFFELGFSLCNLFELASDEDLQRPPDAVYTYGVPGGALDRYGELPTVFYDDDENDLMVGAVPNEDMYGYFGYLKKMVLTLHNIRRMKTGYLPYHGAMVQITVKGNKATFLMIGDTGAGKSETLEAFRILGEEMIEDITIIADDMGSLEIDEEGNVIGYGTEVGAFVRLDDLQPGFAFGQMDRTIFMSPAEQNARALLPVTTYNNVVCGFPIDYVLYANNYEEIGEEHPIIEQFESAEEALDVFRSGAVMSKGTTTTKGLVHSYFANIFGPPQYRSLHDSLAEKYFEQLFENGVFVGQMRTRLGIPGWERKGPEATARELLKMMEDL